MSPVPEGVLAIDATELADDVTALDLLARFALEARRCGYRIIVRGASPRLLELIEFAGLSAALGVARVAQNPGQRVVGEQALGQRERPGASRSGWTD